jgi:hypothetical protein
LKRSDLPRSDRLGHLYRDIKKDSKAAPAPEVIARRMRLELKVSEEITIERRDRVITAVVDELMKQPPAA